MSSFIWFKCYSCRSVPDALAQVPASTCIPRNNARAMMLNMMKRLPVATNIGLYPDSGMAPEDRVAQVDQVLVERIRAGDGAAFDALYLTHARVLWGFANRLIRSSAEAEEIVQDVFAAIWERRAEWEVSGTVAAYLFRAVRNRALNSVRHRDIVLRVEDSAVADDVTPGFGVPPFPIDEAVAADDLEEVLRKAVDALPERRRLAFTLRVVHQMTFTEIGDALGISEKGAFVLVARARESLLPLQRLFDAI